MGLADTLSRKVKVGMDGDNREITLLRGNDQYHHIHAINSVLAEKIATSSSSDPIVTKALVAMNDKKGEPWIPQTTKTDWEFTNSALYFKPQLYILEPACHNLVKSLHKSPARGHEGFFHTLHHMQKDYWWQACQPSYDGSSQDVLIVRWLK